MGSVITKNLARGYKTFFMLNLAEHDICHLINLKLLTISNSFLLNIAQHEIFSANKYENTNYFLYLLAEKIPRIPDPNPTPWSKYDILYFVMKT